MQDIKLGKAGPLELSAAPSAVVCAVLLAAALGAAGYFWLHLSLFECIAGGIIGAVLHYYSEIWHQTGHAGAAAAIGHPMTGVRMVYIVGLSVYPPNEPDLPAELHIRRALGGPRYSLVMTGLGVVMLVLTYFSSGPTDWVFDLCLFFFLDNLLFFTLGSFLPLGFTDGSTLLRWWPKRNQKP